MHRLCLRGYDRERKYVAERAFDMFVPALPIVSQKDNRFRREKIKNLNLV